MEPMRTAETLIVEVEHNWKVQMVGRSAVRLPFFMSFSVSSFVQKL